MDTLPHRLLEDPVQLPEMVGHRGECLFCKDGRGQPGTVKMSRDMHTMALQPDRCRCLLCGQSYFMEIKNVKEWEENQWNQKSELRGI